MLPSVAPAAVVGRKIVSYAWVTVATSLVLWPVAGTSWFYPLVAVALGAVFLVEAHGLARRAVASEDVVAIKPMRLFHWSNMYLSLLFLGVALDPLLTR
jgi:protoheme IX farnesyltransferase